MVNENIIDAKTKAKKVKAEAEGKTKKITSKAKDKVDNILGE